MVISLIGCENLSERWESVKGLVDSNTVLLKKKKNHS